MESLRTLRDQILADLLPGIIHEINNPLGAIIMNLSITRDDIAAWNQDGVQPDTVMMLEAITDMETASSRINDYLRAMSYFCGPRFLEDPADLDVPTYIRYAMALAHNRYKRVMPITFEAGTQAGPIVQAPPALFLLLLLLFGGLLAGGMRHLRVTGDPIPLCGALCFMTIAISVSGLDAISGVFLGLGFLGSRFSGMWMVREVALTP